MRSIDTGTELEIVDMYVNQGLTGQQILDKVGVYKTRKSIYDILRRYDIDARDSRTMRDPGLNHTYFSNIDSEEKAYALGLMISDGWVTSGPTRSPQISFSLTEEDRFLVDWIADQWGTQHRPFIVSKPDAKPMVRSTVTSGKMNDDLALLGVDSRKSTVSIFPDVDKDVVPHVLRGIFDGDGCAHIHKDTGKTHLVFNGTLSLVGQIAWILRKAVDVTYVKPSSSGDTTFASIRFTKSEDVKAIYGFMYPGTHTIRLDRKVEKIESNFD